jgi:hypothetical protein
MPNLPFQNCYWVLPGRFLAGEYPRTLDEPSSTKKIAALLQSGVTAFIDLTHPQDSLQPYNHFLESLPSQKLSYQRFPIRDVSVPVSRQHTLDILNAIDGLLDQDQVVYLHCWGGVGRTGTIVGCWLARHGYPGHLALVRLQILWQHCAKSAYRTTPETAEQERYVINWVE